MPSGSEAHWEVVERILFIYAKLNPGIAYVQGMNEVVGPIYYTFATDPNSQWKGEWRSSVQGSGGGVGNDTLLLCCLHQSTPKQIPSSASPT